MAYLLNVPPDPLFHMTGEIYHANLYLSETQACQGEYLSSISETFRPFCLYKADKDFIMNLTRFAFNRPRKRAALGHSPASTTNPTAVA